MTELCNEAGVSAPKTWVSNSRPALHSPEKYDAGFEKRYSAHDRHGGTDLHVLGPVVVVASNLLCHLKPPKRKIAWNIAGRAIRAGGRFRG